MAERAKLFGDDESDLSRFTPKTDDTPNTPELARVREVATAAGFPNRDPVRAPLIPERHYYRTGRDTQFNTKVRADVKTGYIAIANEDGVPIGKVLEDALDALRRERQKRG